MGFIKDIKCILCLLKCSKYLYYAKKALCITTMLITAVMTVNILRGRKIKLGFMKGLM